MKIDIYAHICPQKFVDIMNKKNNSWEKIAGTSRLNGGTALFETEKRLEIMKPYEDYVQVLTPTGQVLEPFFPPEEANAWNRDFNDCVAEIVSQHPDKFVAAAASIQLGDVDAALKEIERCIEKLGFKGIHLHTPIFPYDSNNPGYNYDTMKPLDSPEFMPIYEAMSKYNLPIWIHPVGQGGVPNYPGENRGKYALFHVFGWPMESAMAMGRIVCSGILMKYPNLKFIIHHIGSAIVPALAGRIANEFDKFKAIGRLKYDKPEDDPFLLKNAAEYFKMFYADTAIYGDPYGLECGYYFFSPERVVFGTDFSYDLANGDKFIYKTIESVWKMRVSDADKKAIFEDNAKRILRLEDNSQ